ncbi:conserved Plasmodium membrane protein, unknown function [Plasmodium relictum]|uniref:Uncharacterized protein n=1 Tax=Plasmodium relictum TaxID=85471 RepID=A0A1J1HCK8_PLARL|nr:conserved Plasmodium membrane protein, unknown function [Plasmodium relictum]CRH01156.1 conserved Plasmodium membrane protein, unknown function [Plasmodium relictum]
MNILKFLKNTKFQLDKINISFLFFQNILLFNLPFKNIEVRNIIFEFDFIKRIFSFFNKKEKKRKKKRICFDKLKVSFDFEDLEKYNSYYNFYFKLKKPNIFKGIFSNICFKVFILFLKILLKFYFIRIKKIYIKIYYNHKHRHNKYCDNKKNICNGKSKYHLLFYDIYILYNKIKIEKDKIRENNDTIKEIEREKQVVSVNNNINNNNDKFSYIFSCEKIVFNKENNRSSLILIKNSFFFIEEKKIFFPIFYIKIKTCEFKEILFLISNIKKNGFINDLIEVIKKEDLKNLICHYKSNNNCNFLLINFLICFNNLFIDIHLKNKICKNKIKNAYFKSIKNKQGCNDFKFFFKSFFSYTQKNLILVSERKNSSEKKISLKNSLIKNKNKYNLKKLDMVYNKFKLIKKKKNFVFKKLYNKYHFNLSNLCLIFEIIEFLYIYHILEDEFQLYWCNENIKEEKLCLSYTVNSINDIYFVCIQNSAIYLNKNINKFILLYENPVLRKYEEELFYDTCLHDKGEIIKIEIKNICNYKEKKEFFANFNNNNEMQHDSKKENSVFLSYEERFLFSLNEKSCYFFLNDITFKSTYYDNNILYEYILNDKTNIILKKGKEKNLLTIYLNNFICNLSALHINFFFYIYSVYCFNIKKRLYYIRNPLRKKNKKVKNTNLNNSFFFLSLIVSNCSLRLFCISYNFYIDNNNVHILKKEKEKLTYILFTFDLKYILKINEETKKLNKANMIYLNYFYFNNVKIQMKECTNILRNLCIFKKKKRISNNKKDNIINNYDFSIKIKDKKIYVDILNKAKIIFLNFVIYQIYLAIRRIIYLYNINVKSKNVIKKFKKEKKKIKRNVYNFLLKKMKYENNSHKSRNDFHYLNNFFTDFYINKTDEKYLTKEYFYLKHFNKNNFKYKLKSVYNNDSMLKYLIQIKLKCKVTFISFDSFLNLNYLRKMENEQLLKNQFNVNLNGNICLFYFDILNKNNIECNRFIKLYINFYKLKLNKITNFNKTYTILYFKNTKEYKEYDVFHRNFKKNFIKRKINHNTSNETKDYCILVSTISNLDFTYEINNFYFKNRHNFCLENLEKNKRLMNEIKNFNNKISNVKKFNTKTKIYGNNLSLIFKTNDFFHFLNKYLFIDFFNLFSLKNFCETSIFNNEDIFYFEEKELHNKFSFRNFMILKNQVKNYVNKNELLKIKLFQDNLINNKYNLNNFYKIKKCNMKNILVSLNKYNITFDNVILFLPSIMDNKNFIISKNNFYIKNKLIFKRNQVEKRILLYDKIYVYFLNSFCYSNEKNSIMKNVNILINYYRNVIYKINLFSLFIYVSGIVYLSPMKFKLFQDILIENILNNNLEYFYKKLYKNKTENKLYEYNNLTDKIYYNNSKSSKRKNNDNKICKNANCNNRNFYLNENKFLVTKKERKDLNIVLYFFNIHINLENDHLKNGINYIFSKYTFVKIIKYVKEHTILTYIKGVIPVVLNYFYEYPFDVLLYNKKIKKNNYMKILSNMNNIKSMLDFKKFDLFLKKKLSSYNSLQKKKKKKKIYEIFYNRFKNNDFAFDIINDIHIKVNKVFLSTDIFELLNLYIFFFIGDKNLFINQIEKLLKFESYLKRLYYNLYINEKKKLFSKKNKTQKVDKYKRKYINNFNLRKMKINVLRKVQEKKINDSLIYMYKRMIKNLSSFDFNNYNCIIKTNNIYKTIINVKYVNFMFNFLFYENFLSTIKKLCKNDIKKYNKNIFSLIYKGSLHFCLFFNLRKSIFLNFVKNSKYIFFNNFIFDNYLEMENFSKKNMTYLKNIILNIFKNIKEELSEFIHFNFSLTKKNNLYLLNNNSFYCISKNINMRIIMKSYKLVYFLNNIKNIKLNDFYLNDILLNNLTDKNNYIKRNDYNYNNKDNKHIYDLQLLNNKSENVNKSNDIWNWEFRGNNITRLLINNNNNINNNYINNINDNNSYNKESKYKYLEPKYLNVTLKYVNIVIKLKDFLYLINKLYEMIYFLNYYEEMNVCFYKICERILKNKYICKICRTKELNYSTWIINTLISNLHIHIYENIYHKLKKLEKKNIIYLNIKGIYEYISCSKKNYTLVKKHDFNLTSNIFFSKNNIYEEFAKNIQIHFISLKTKEKTNFFLFLKNDLNIFLTKNTFRKILYLYDELKNKKNYKMNEKKHVCRISNYKKKRIIYNKYKKYYRMTKSKRIIENDKNKNHLYYDKVSENYSLHNIDNLILSCNEKYYVLNYTENMRKQRKKSYIENRYFKLSHDDYVIINYFKEKIFSYESKEIKNRKTQKGDLLHMFYLKKGNTIIFPSLEENITKKNHLIMIKKNNFYNFISNICLFNNTNYDMIFLYKNYKCFLYSKKNSYIKSFNMKNDNFCILIFYNKKLYFSEQVNLNSLKKGNFKNKEKILQIIQDKKNNLSKMNIINKIDSMYCVFNNLIYLKEIKNIRKFLFLEVEYNNNDKNYLNNFQFNKYNIYNIIDRKFIKLILNEEYISNIKNNDSLILDLTAIKNENSLYIHIDNKMNLKNNLPLKVHYKCEHKLKVLNSFKQKSILCDDFDLNVKFNKFQGNKLEIYEDIGNEKERSNNINNETKNSHKKLYYTNVIKKPNEIIITCYTLIYLYSYNIRNIELDRKKIYFKNDLINKEINKTLYTYSLKEMKKFIGFYNGPFNSVVFENNKINNISINNCKEVNICENINNKSYISSYILNYMKNNNINNKINSLLVIYPRYIVINKTNYNLVMFAANSVNYFFQRKSRNVINLIEKNENKFFFKIKNTNNFNDYMLLSGSIDIAKESSYICCFTKLFEYEKRKEKNNKVYKLKKLSKNKNKKKKIFINLKITICEGIKLKGDITFNKCFYIYISEYRTPIEKKKKYITYINDNISNFIENNDNSIMNINKYIEKEEEIKKIYIYNSMNASIIFDIFHYSEIIYLIKNSINKNNEKESYFNMEKLCNDNKNEKINNNKNKENFFFNIFNIESSENTSSVEFHNDSENPSCDSNKLSKYDLNYIIKNKHHFQKYMKKNKKKFRYIKENSIKYLPLRKNKNIRNSFFIIYPYKYSKISEIIKFSLEKKRYILKYKKKNKITFIEIFLIQKKNKLLIKISQYVDNIIQIRGKVNMNLLFKEKVDMKEFHNKKNNNIKEGDALKKKKHEKETYLRDDKISKNEYIINESDSFKKYIFHSIIKRKNNKKFIIYKNNIYNYNKIIDNSILFNILDCKHNKHFCKFNNVAKFYRKKYTYKIISNMLKYKMNENIMIEKNYKVNNSLKKKSYYQHFENKNVTFIESMNKYKFFFRSKTEKSININYYFEMKNDIKINFFSTYLIVNNDITKQKEVEINYMRALDQKEKHFIKAYNSNDRNPLIKKKKNSHICTFVLHNTNILITKENNKNSISFHLEDFSIFDLSSYNIKKIFFKKIIDNNLYKQRNNEIYNNESNTNENFNINDIMNLELIYENYKNLGKIKKFELSLSHICVNLSLEIIEKFYYCYEKFFKRKKIKKNYKKDRFLFESNNSVSTSLREGKKGKIKIENFKVYPLKINLFFIKRNDLSIYKYKGKKNFIFNVKPSYLSDIKDAEFFINSLYLKNIKEKDFTSFTNFVLNFYMKELYKNLFFYLTKMNLINKYLKNYYNFFHLLMDNNLFNIDISRNFKNIKNEIEKKESFYISQNNSNEEQLTLKDLKGIEHNNGNSKDKNKYYKKSNSIIIENNMSKRKEKFHQGWENLNTFSDSNFYVKPKKKKKIKNINKKLFYIHNDKKVFIFNEEDDSDLHDYNINSINNNFIPNNKNEQIEKKENLSNFNLFNNSLRTLGKDILSSINYYLYDKNNQNLIDKKKANAKKEKIYILQYFSNNIKGEHCNRNNSLKVDTKEKNENFITYFSIYKKNKIVYDHYSFKILNLLDKLLTRNLIISSYIYDKRENFIFLFCDEYFIKLNSKNKTVMKKENIVKVEISCIYFNLIFDKEKSLILNIKNIIKKNKNNFLCFYFDILFKKNKKRLISKIQKKLLRILYFLYHIFHFIYNYNKKVKHLKKNDSLKKKDYPSVTIFEDHQKEFFSFSSINHLNFFYLHIKNFLFNLCQ